MTRRSATSWIVWGAALVAYVAAVVHRSSFGVAGLVAADRFQVDATVLSLFVVIQLGTYAAMQLPVGVGVDRWGPRRMLTIGSVTMAIGQLVMTFAPTVGVALGARVLIGSGDAAIFVSAVRLVATWFDRRRVPLLTQLTGITGQLGQIVTAIPFTLVLHRLGWTTAFGALVVLGAGASLVVRLGVRDTPDGTAAAAGPSRLAGLADTVRHPGTWLGFWTHMIGGVSGNVVVLMWGVPFLVQGQGLTPAQAGALLTINVVVGIVAGPFIGEYTARHPVRRSWAVLAVATGTTLGGSRSCCPRHPGRCGSSRSSSPSSPWAGRPRSSGSTSPRRPTRPTGPARPRASPTWAGSSRVSSSCCRWAWCSTTGRTAPHRRSRTTAPASRWSSCRWRSR